MDKINYEPGHHQLLDLDKLLIRKLPHLQCASLLCFDKKCQIHWVHHFQIVSGLVISYIIPVIKNPFHQAIAGIGFLFQLDQPIVHFHFVNLEKYLLF